jgi:hypothetical protein
MKIVVALILLCALPVSAQSFVTGIERELSLSMHPAYPSPGERVRISLDGYAVDLDRSMVIWYVNNREVTRGAGLRDFEMDAPEIGGTRTVRAVAEESSGLIAIGEAALRPADITLLWEADSYTHPFYQGRALPGSGSTIRAHAVSDLRRGTTRISESDIIFSWFRDGARFASGRSRSSVTFPGPTLFDSDRIVVRAESLDGNIVAQTEILVRGEDPQLELYEHHPLFGTLYHRAFVGTVLNTEEEQQVAVVPFFAPHNPRDPSLAYEWTVGGTRIAPRIETPEILTLRRSPDFNGIITVALSLSSVSDIFLKASNAWSIQFSRETTFANPFLSL